MAGVTAPIDARDLPLDETSRAALAGQGLTYRRVDAASDDALRYIEALDRGFLGERASAERIPAIRQALEHERLTGVFDEAGPTRIPVGTVSTWVDEITIDLDSTLPVWAISGVTVSSTHRRRGVARAMLEGELRTAAAAGIPIAGLTVSEATIYGRYGFAPAVDTTTWRIDTKRARWIGPRPTVTAGGRLDTIDNETACTDAVALHEVVRRRMPGEVGGPSVIWRNATATGQGARDAAKVRAVRYTDVAGTPRGVLVYAIDSHPEDYTRNTLQVRALLADGDDAYAALWRFAIEHDLVGTVEAGLLSLDEPLRWMVDDVRALDVRRRDHEWIRVLDVPACLGARRYRRAGSALLEVTDPLGFCAGTWLLRVAEDGAATVTLEGEGEGEGTTAQPGSAQEPPSVGLTVVELGLLLLGGVRAATLRAAGRVRCTAEAAAWLDETLAPALPPRLSYWY